jgi:hypothetical protein
MLRSTLTLPPSSTRSREACHERAPQPDFLRRQELLVRAAGLEPAQAFLPYGFSYHLRLSPPRIGAFVVWTIPSPWRAPVPATHFRRYPSSLYTFPSPGLARDCHLTGSPDFGQFYFSVSRRALNFELSPLRLPVSPRPRDTLVIGGRFKAAKENLTRNPRAMAKPSRPPRLPSRAGDRRPRLHR